MAEQVREEAQEGDARPRRFLGLKHTRTMKMSDDVLAIKLTPDGRLITLALLDSTIQVLHDVCNHQAAVMMWC